jgi:hypothetical protein
MLRDLVQDLRYACRTATKSPVSLPKTRYSLPELMLPLHVVLNAAGLRRLM